MSKAVFLCIWLACLLDACAANGNWANLNIVNNSPIGISWDVIDGYTPEQVNIKPGGSDSIHLLPSTYKISRDDDHLTMSDVNGFRQVEFPCDKGIKLMLDNKSIEIGSDFIQEAVGGDTYNLTLY